MIKNNLKEQNKKVRIKLLIILVITAIYMLAEFLGGIFTNSLALLADAGHMIVDVTTLGFSLFACFSKKNIRVLQNRNSCRSN